MAGGFIFLIVLVILLILVLGIILIKYGIFLCQKNNAIGVLLLFLTLNIVGLVWDFAILYNAKNGMYVEKLKLKEQLKKEKRNSNSFFKIYEENEKDTKKDLL